MPWVGFEGGGMFGGKERRRERGYYGVIVYYKYSKVGNKVTNI